MQVFLGFLFFLLAAGAVAFAVFGIIRNKGKRPPRARSIAGFAAAAVFFILFCIIPFGLVTIDAGEVGVVKVFGEAKEPKNAGIHFINVFSTKIDIYDAKVQQLEIATEVYTKDAQPADVAMAVQFKIDTSRVVEVAKTFGSMDALKSRLLNVSIEKAKNVLSAETAMNIIEIRSTLSPAIQAELVTLQEQYFVRFEAVLITDIAFSAAFEKAVEEKMIAEQKKLEAEYAKEQAEIKAKEQAEVARITAESNLVVAKLNAEKALAEAKGNADAQVAIAQGAAKALKIQYLETARMLGLPITETELFEEREDGDGNPILVSVGFEYEINAAQATQEQFETLTKYMQYINYLDAWDGKLPQVIGDGSSLGGIIITP